MTGRGYSCEERLNFSISRGGTTFTQRTLSKAGAKISARQ
jgi:hypothetical protein